MPRGAILTPELAKQVRNLVRREVQVAQGERKPKISRPRAGRDQLWALTPAGGIPALSTVDNVTSLGSAECEIYRDAIETAGGTDRVLEPILVDVSTTKTAVVHNSGDDAIDGDIYVPIGRTDHGAWRVQPQAAGGASNNFAQWYKSALSDGTDTTWGYTTWDGRYGYGLDPGHDDWGFDGSGDLTCSTTGWYPYWLEFSCWLTNTTTTLSYPMSFYGRASGSPITSGRQATGHAFFPAGDYTSAGFATASGASMTSSSTGFMKGQPGTAYRVMPNFARRSTDTSTEVTLLLSLAIGEKLA